MKYLLTLLICALAPTTFADDKGLPSQFKGNWSGTGVYRKAGVQTNCSKFKMNFDGTENTMTFDGGERVCDSHSETFASVTMQFIDGKLFFYGQEVGSLNGNLLESHFSMDEGNGHIRHWRMSMRREGRTIVYEESRTMDEETTPLISFAGILNLD